MTGGYQTRMLARRIADLEKSRLRQRQPQLGNSTIDSGAIQAVNESGTLTMVMGQQFDGTNAPSVVLGPTPPIPSVPGVFSSPGAIRIYWDGTFANADFAPMDFSRVTVHILPDGDYDDATFDPTNQANIYGSFAHAAGGEISAILEPGDYVVVLVSWTLAGKFSEESQVGLGTSEIIEADTGPDGFAPATAPTVLWAGGIGSVFYRWTPVPNDDPVEYALYVRAGSPPTTTDDTYLVASGLIQQESIREAIGPAPDDPGGPEVLQDVTPGVDYYGIVVAYDADGQGPDSLPAIAQSVLITDPDIATDAIATRHLQADSVGVDQIQAGAIDADKLAARLVVASELLLGSLDNTGLDPTTMNPNMLPALVTANMNDSAAPAVGMWGRGDVSGWTVTSEQFSPANDDPYWERMAPGAVQAARFERAAASGSTPARWRTQVVVEPNTEYRFEFNTSMPGMDPAMAASGITPAFNSVRWMASSDSTFQDAETISWKSFRKEDTPRPDLTKFDRGVVKTGNGQTVLWLELQIRAEHLVGNTGGYVMPMPELRKVESTTVALTVANPASVDAADVTPDPAGTAWKASAVWSGTTSSIVRSSAVITASSSGGAFGPSYFSTPGRYATPGENLSFQQAKGVRVTTQSGGTGLGLRARIVAPAQAVPALSPMESLLVAVGLGGLTQSATGLDDITFTASWYDSSNVLISNQALIDLDAAGLVAQGITNVTENYFTLQLSPPVGATKVVFWGEWSNGPAGNITASTDQMPTLHGLRLYTLDAINYNYGSMAKRHVQIDSSGIRLVNAQGQIQISIPTDESETPVFNGGIQAAWARFLGGASFEGQSEIAKDATISLSDGIKSPVGTPTLTQEYEQYTIQREPDTWGPGFSSKPTLNPSNITGMTYRNGYLHLTENRSGGVATWMMRMGGTMFYADFFSGWSWASPFTDTRDPSRNLFMGEFGGAHWAWVYNGTSVISNRIPAGVVPTGVKAQAFWNPVNDRFYVFYPHIDGSGRNVYKRLNINNTSAGTMTLEATTVSGSGTAPSSTNLAGAFIDGGTIYTIARGTTAVQVYVFAAGDDGASIPGSRWDLAGNSVGFTRDATNFFAVDTAGRLTKYSDWTWTETNHKIFAGLTWFDSDTGGTGVHETDITTLASVALKKRISGIRVTLPQVPDNGGSDDPDRWRLYAYKGSALALPGGRTSMFLQSQGGSPSQQTTYIIPANGLVTSGTNPPATNNFPATGPGKIISAAVDGSSNPLISLKGNGDYILGKLSTRTGRMATWVMTAAGTAVAHATYQADTGGYTSTLGEHTANDGWVGVSYSGGGVFTCTESGIYEIENGFNFASGSANTRRWIMVGINEATINDTTAYRFLNQACISGNFQSVLRIVVKLVVGDTFQFGYRQDSGASLSATATQGFKIDGTSYSRYMQIFRKA